MSVGGGLLITAACGMSVGGGILITAACEMSVAGRLLIAAAGRLIAAEKTTAARQPSYTFTDAKQTNFR